MVFLKIYIVVRFFWLLKKLKRTKTHIFKKKINQKSNFLLFLSTLPTR